MFVDPQVVTLSAVAKTLPKVPSGKVESISRFSGDDGNTVLTVHQNSTNNRARREIRLTLGKVAADPITAINKSLNASVVIVFDEPKYGFTDAELIAAYAALSAHVAAGSNAKLTQLLNGEL